MNRQPVKSSNIVSVGHDNSSLTLEIEYHTGKVWQYQPVTEHAYREMLKAESVTKFFNQNIKDNPDITGKAI